MLMGSQLIDRQKLCQEVCSGATQSGVEPCALAPWRRLWLELTLTPPRPVAVFAASDDERRLVNAHRGGTSGAAEHPALRTRGTASRPTHERVRWLLGPPGARRRLEGRRRPPVNKEQPSSAKPCVCGVGRRCGVVEMRGEERRGEERSDRRSRTTMVVAGPPAGSPGAMVRSRRDSNDHDQRPVN